MNAHINKFKANVEQSTSQLTGKSAGEIRWSEFSFNRGSQVEAAEGSGNIKLKPQKTVFTLLERAVLLHKEKDKHFTVQVTD